MRLAALAAVLGCGAAACGGRGSAATVDPAPAAATTPATVTAGTGTVTLIQTGHDRGFLEPCGCSGFAFGGWARRLPALAALRRAEGAILIHVGETVHHRLPDDLPPRYITGRVALQGELVDRAGYAAVFLPAADLAVWPEAVGPPAVTRLAAPPGRRPYGVRTSAGGLAVLLFGFDGPEPPTLEPAGDPVLVAAALREALAAESSVDLVIAVGTALTGPGVTALRGTWNGPPLVVLSRILAAMDAPAGARVVAAREAAENGETVLEWRLQLADGGITPAPPVRHRPGTEAVEDPTVRARLDAWETGLSRDGDWALIHNSWLRTGTPRYAGPDACTKCHAAEAAHVAGTPHARAGDTLRPRGRSDPECLRCHTTGMGWPGGFQNWRDTPALGAVTCESCHGPSREHVDRPDDPTARPPKVSEAACRQCHTWESHPTFDFATALPKVRHRSPR